MSLEEIIENRADIFRHLNDSGEGYDADVVPSAAQHVHEAGGDHDVDVCVCDGIAYLIGDAHGGWAVSVVIG